ncbi:MAG: hypothetical protein CMJ15_09885 [Pelagibacterium sp.]|nr:hypothetical protein [Pelagibacterium sp.]|tara:strand:+ start:15723 stop:15959 length:237 start_codon:yes stop_codon:yes gene_type:complete
MFFTKLGIIVARLALFLGAFRVATGLFFAFNRDATDFAARYLGSKTSGQAIDQGLLMIAFAIVLGILAEISRQVNQKD